MKKFFLVFLCLACIVSAFFQKYGIGSDYQMTTSAYIERLDTVVANKPEKAELTFTMAGEPAIFEQLIPAYPEWVAVDIDSVLDVPDAIEQFMNNLIVYMRHFFVNLSGVFPKLWNNIKSMFSYIGNLLSGIYDYLTQIWGMLTDNNSFAWLKAVCLALVPVDWEALEADGVEHDFNLKNILEDFFVPPGLPS